MTPSKFCAKKYRTNPLWTKFYVVFEVHTGKPRQTIQSYQIPSALFPFSSKSPPPPTCDILQVKNLFALPDCHENLHAD